MADILPLWQKALLAAYNLGGDCHTGQLLGPLHHYNWTTIYPSGPNEPQPHATWYYLNNDPATWPEMDQAVADAMRDAAMDCLYVGGGSGRFGKYLESLGRSCHHIDTSDDAITLMNLRGASCEKMDGAAMTFAADAYPLVVIGIGIHDSVPDAAAAGMIAEAARVAEHRLILAGFTLGDDVVQYTEVMEWNGETETVASWARPSSLVVGWIEATGMSIVRVVQFTVAGFMSDGTPTTDSYWLIEAEHA